MLHRKRLGVPEALGRGERHMVELVAPAGYGKTTLVGMWRKQLSERGVGIAHLALEESDRDPVRLLSRLHAAVLDRPSDPAASLFDTQDAGLELVFSELAAKTDPYVVFLDDVHILKDSPSVAALQWLCNRQPNNVDLVVASREISILQLQERLMHNELTRVQSEELALTEDEARHVINDLHGLEMSTREIGLLHRRTEGWPAAVRLAAIALSSARSRSSVLHGFVGSNRHVTDYLAEAVLENLDEEEVDFLMRVAVPDRIDGDIAAALTGHVDSHKRLQQIEKRNLFLVPLDQNRDAYRFHALFGEFLRTRLHHFFPETWAKCLAIAENHAIERDDYDAAIEYALRARRYDKAARLLAEHAKTLVHRKGQHTALLGWIERLPARILARHPQIQIHYSWSLVFANRYSESQNVLRRLRLDVENDDSAERDALLAEIKCAEELNDISQSGLSDHAGASVELAEAWLERWRDAEDYQRGIASVVLGYGRKTFCDWEGALAAASQGRNYYASAESPYGVAWGDIVRVVTLVKAGRIRLAHAECLRSLDECRRVLGPNSRSHCMLSAYLAQIEYEFDNLSASRAALDYGARFIASQTPIDPIIVSYTTLALLYMHDGDPVAACDILHEGEQCGAWREAPRLMTTMVAMRALVHLRCGDVAASETLLDHDALRVASNPPEYHGVVADKRRTLQIRLALASGRPKVALEEISDYLTHARRTGQQRKLASLYILESLAHRQQGLTERAHRSLQNALLIGAEEGLRRLFLDEGEGLTELLRHYWSTQCAPQSIRQSDTTLSWTESLLGHEIDPRTIDDADRGHPSLLGELTQRELQLLRLLDSGLSNKKLADNLFVTEGTIKWHLHNIYTKLGISNRIEAINQARQLGLIR